MKTLAALACGAVLGILGCAVWFRWYFRDVMK